MFGAKIPPKMEPQGAQEHATAIVLGPQRPLKSSMDPFSRKSKPPDLNFIKKVTPNLRKSSLETSISSKKWPQTFENQASRPQFHQKMIPKFKNRWNKNDSQTIKFQKKTINQISQASHPNTPIQPNKPIRPSKPILWDTQELTPYRQDARR